MIAGVLEPVSGSIEIGGQTILHASPRRMQELRVGRVPEDRMGVGLLTQSPLADSMALPRVHAPPFSRAGLLDRAAIVAFARKQIEKFGIRAAGPLARTGTLSGGNLQKALLARELAADPLVVLAAQPTRGLDVAAAGFVHSQFLELRSQGVASWSSARIWKSCSSWPTASPLCRLAASSEICVAEATVERIGLMMTGAEAA